MRGNRTELGGEGAEWGDLKVEFETFPAGLDTAPLLRGLPDGACPCPHWGYLFSGSVRVRYRDHEETFRAGDAFYMAPGHVPVFLEATDMFEVSPAAALAQVMEVVVANASALELGGQPVTDVADDTSSTFLESIRRGSHAELAGERRLARPLARLRWPRPCLPPAVPAW